MTNTMNVIHQRRQNARTGTQNIFMEDDVYFIVSPTDKHAYIIRGVHAAYSVHRQYRNLRRGTANGMIPHPYAIQAHTRFLGLKTGYEQ